MFQKILVINLMYIGDLLFTTPLLRALRTSYPNAEIVILADGKNAEVIKYNRHISSIIAIDKKGYHNKFINYLKLIGSIRRQNYDLVINLHRNERASAIAAFSGAKKIAGFASRGFGKFFDYLIQENTKIHQVEAYLEILDVLGIDYNKNSGLEMWVNEESSIKAKELWKSIYSTSRIPVIGINTGGSWPTKRWKKEGFAELADQILNTGMGVAFFGGPMDKEDVELIISKMKNAKHPLLSIFTGRTSLLEMAALVKKCIVLVSGDSGPMHIAVSQNVPIIALFGPSDPKRYSPYKQLDAVITNNTTCLACGEHYCSGHECMNGISPEYVFNKILSKIKQ